MRGVTAKQWNTVETNRSGLNTGGTKRAAQPSCALLGDTTVSLQGQMHGCTDPEIMHGYR